MDQPPSSSMKSLGKAIQDGLAHSAPGCDKMKRIDMDDSLKSTPVPKINQPPEILSYLSDTRDHSPSRDEGRFHDPRASNCGHDDNNHTGESSITRSTGIVRDGITSPCAAELVNGTAAASSSKKSVIPDGPSMEENVNSPLGRPSSSTPSPTKAVQDAYGSEVHMLALRRPPSSLTKSRGKAIKAYDQEHDEVASSTEIIPKANADAGPSVRAPAQHHDGVVAAIGGPARPNASDVASNAAAAIPAFPQHDIDVVIAAIGGGGGGAGADQAAGQPNAARQVPAPAQLNGGGIAVIAARPVLVQPNAGGPAPNAAPPVPVLPPNPGVNDIDEGLTISIIRPLRNPAGGDEGEIWDKLN